MFRKTYLKVNLDNYYHNCEVFEKLTNKKLMAVVKANAYGVGDYYMAKQLEKKGVHFFAVSSLDEAMRLRNHGITSDILIMGYVNELDIVKENDLSIIIPTKEYVDSHQDQLKDVRCHIKINTGLNRLGCEPEQIKEVLDTLLKIGAKVEGYMTHYACSGNKEVSYKQYNIFKDTLASLNYDFKYIHSTATDAALLVKDEVSNYCRIGIGLLGHANIEHSLDLKVVLSLEAEVVYSKQVKAGEGVSYSYHYISDGDGYINTVAIGYADGVSKKLENTKVYIDGEEGTIVGTICMDLLMVKTAHPHKVGSMCEIFGEHISILDTMNHCGTSVCNVITDINDRVTRLYMENGQVKDVLDERS